MLKLTKTSTQHYYNVEMYSEKGVYQKTLTGLILHDETTDTDEFILLELEGEKIDHIALVEEFRQSVKEVTQ